MMSSPRHGSLLLALLLSSSQAGNQSAVERAAPEARKAWERLCAASGSPSREPITAFHLKAEVLTRSAGAQNNELRIDYRYLAPDCIRFMLPSHNETGRFGPAQEQYWLKSRKEVVVLAGREYKEDRRQVDDMCVLARNYVALSNPGRLNLLALERRASAPGDLGPELLRRSGKLTWLALETPDFALVRSEGASAPAGTIYLVELGLREDALPALVVIREKPRAAAAPGEPLLVELGRFEDRAGFQIPFQLLVRVLDRSHQPPVFSRDPSQEIYVTEADLRPQLTSDDFRPR